MFSKTTYYALFAISNLSANYGKKPKHSKEIAFEEHIPQHSLATILNKLKRTGFISSKQGKTGGYYLLKSPDEVSLLDVVNLFDNTLAYLPCESGKIPRPCKCCKHEEPCNIKKLFNQIRDITASKLQHATFDKMVEKFS